MAKKSAKNQKTKTGSRDMVVVTFVDDLEQAREFQTLAENNDIPAIVQKRRESDPQNEGIAIMVPEEYLDEAHVLIESQGAFDDFYDFGLEEEDDENPSRLRR